MLDVVVVSYRSPDDLATFLEAYRQLPDGAARNLTVVEVDPREEDASNLQASNSLGDYLVLCENVGYGKACNIAAARKSGQTIAFFNADTIILPGVLDQCVDVMNEYPDWAILGPRQTDGKGRITHAGIVGTLKQPQHRGWRQVDGQQFSDVRDVVSVSGSAYFIRRNVWDELTTCPIYQQIVWPSPAIGAFLPTPLFWEETWCSYHAHAHGHRVIYYGPASMVHKVGGARFAEGRKIEAGMMKGSQSMFRTACDAHDIEHD